MLQPVRRVLTAPWRGGPRVAVTLRGARGRLGHLTSVSGPGRLCPAGSTAPAWAGWSEGSPVKYPLSSKDVCFVGLPFVFLPSSPSSYRCTALVLLGGGRSCVQRGCKSNEDFRVPQPGVQIPIRAFSHLVAWNTAYKSSCLTFVYLTLKVVLKQKINIKKSSPGPYPY